MTPDYINSGHKRAKHDFSAYSLKPQIANVTRLIVLEAQVHTCPQARTMSETRFSSPHLHLPPLPPVYSGCPRLRHSTGRSFHFHALPFKPEPANVARITVLEAQVHTYPQARTRSETRFSTPQKHRKAHSHPSLPPCLRFWSAVETFHRPEFLSGAGPTTGDC